MKNYTIAIDGPAASGKSTAAGIIAKKLGFNRLDSGMIYRAVTYIISTKYPQLSLYDDEMVKNIKNLKLKFNKGKVYFEDKDITDELHTPMVDKQVGIVAKELYIRNRVHEIQHDIINSADTGFVVDGRDIGTVVLPNAFLKAFITAKDTTRAKRRTSQCNGNYNEVLADIRERDHHDITREHGPLKLADDAVLIENDDMTLEETVDKVIDLFNERKNLKK